MTYTRKQEVCYTDIGHLLDAVQYPVLKPTQFVAELQRLGPSHPFWKNVDVQPNSIACWPWLGHRDRDGYGFYRGMRAHRVAYGQKAKRIPLPTIIIRHECDNPCCCNPFHLLEGTNYDNVCDRTERGRGAKGSKNGRARLVEMQVIDIFRDTDSHSKIAAKYGISNGTVSDIKAGRNWSWLTKRLS